MFVRLLADCDPFIAGDGSLLRELLHPEKAPLDLNYSLAHATVPASQTTKPHRLAASEIYYIIRGSGQMYIDDESQPVGPDSAVYIPPGATQYIANTGQDDLVFLCIVDPAWREEDEEILDSD